MLGVGVARRGAAYVLKVDLSDPAVAPRLPRDVDGVRVVTEVIGTVHPR